jgi:hypothetical protein
MQASPSPRRQLRRNQIPADTQEMGIPLGGLPNNRCPRMLPPTKTHEEHEEEEGRRRFTNALPTNRNEIPKHGCPRTSCCKGRNGCPQRRYRSSASMDAGIPGIGSAALRARAKITSHFAAGTRNNKRGNWIHSIFDLFVPAALRGAARGGHLRRCCSSTMNHIACVSAPCICPPGARAKM